MTLLLYQVMDGTVVVGLWKSFQGPVYPDLATIVVACFISHYVRCKIITRAAARPNVR